VNNSRLEAVRLIRGADLFAEAPFGDRPPSSTLLYSGDADRYRLRKGDILIPRVVRRRLQTRLVDGVLDGCFAHLSVIIFRPRSGAPSTSWFENFLCSKEFLDAAERQCSALGDAIALAPQALSEISIVAPSSNDQPSDSIVALLDRLIRDVIGVIARNATELERVEWRLLEQVVAAALEELGFDVHLTLREKMAAKT
jgi:hypothetical protein